MTWTLRIAAILLVMLGMTTTTRADDKLLEETIGFTAQILYLQAGTPAFIIGAIRNGETFVAGYGETSDGSGVTPHGDTPMRIGSVSKSFAGQVLASLVADGTVNFTDPVSMHLDWDVDWPTMDGREMRLIDLVTHSSGLPREIERDLGPPEDPQATFTVEAFIENLNNDPLMFAPGTAISYSNFAFDVLGAALASAAGKSYADLVRERVTEPAGMNDTAFNLTPDQLAIAMQGHFIDGSPLPQIPSAVMVEGSGALQSTTNDILRWMAWHMDEDDTAGAEVRLLDHASYLPRNGLDAVVGTDGSGHMDAMGLGWVVMDATASSPRILQKSGGMQGMLVYMAFAPAHDIGIFVAINEYDFGAGLAVNRAANALLAQLTKQ